jgi:hypothetical protein
MHEQMGLTPYQHIPKMVDLGVLIMGIFRKSSPPSRNQLMVSPGTWHDISPYTVPAVNGTQLSVNEIQRILTRAAQLEEGERANYTVTTTFTNKRQETEIYSLSVDFEPRSQSITYKRSIV